MMAAVHLGSFGVDCGVHGRGGDECYGSTSGRLRREGDRELVDGMI